MPKLSEVLKINKDHFSPVNKKDNHGFMLSKTFEPTVNPVIRCPLPPVSATPDSLRQFYIGGQIPQARLLISDDSDDTKTTTSTTVKTTNNVTVSTGNATQSTISAKQASIKTGVLNENGQFVTALNISKSFQLLFASSSNPCRIRIYGTALAQNNDLARDLNTSPIPGITQNIITDMILDNAPYQWYFQNRVGNNSDSPQKSLIYVTISNIVNSSTAITVTIGYVPLEI